MAYTPVTDTEWNWLTRRFVALERMPGMRDLFNDSLDPAYSAGERRAFRREIYEAIRSLMAPTEAYPNPYFELTWIRAVEDNPTLLEDVAHNRALLWDAYFRPPETPRNKEAAERAWQAVAGEETELVIVTDKELEVSE